MNSLIVIDDLIINVNSIKHITPTQIYYEVFNETDFVNTTSQKHVAYYKKTRVKPYDAADNIENESGTTSKHQWSWVSHPITRSQFQQICEYIKEQKSNSQNENKGWLN